MSRFDSTGQAPRRRELIRVDEHGREKRRTVYEPSDEVRERHNTMLARLGEYGIRMPRATGGISGKSILDNVHPHRQHDYFYMLDIAHAYESVDVGELARVAHDALYKKHVPRSEITEVTEFIETDARIEGVPGLPMGYPASPYFFNLYCRPLDDMMTASLSLRETFKEQVFAYTRWLDDLTISSPAPITHRTRASVKSYVEAIPGFGLAPSKTKRHELAKGPVTITGLSLYPDRRIQPSPALLDEVNNVFGQMSDRLATGVPLTEKELGKLNGYKSVIHLAGDPLMAGSSTLAHLVRVHKRLIARASELAA